MRVDVDDDGSIWLMDGETPLAEVRIEQWTITEAFDTLSRMITADAKAERL